MFWVTLDAFRLNSLLQELFLSGEGPMLETLDHTIRIGSYTDLFIFQFVSLLCLRLFSSGEVYCFGVGNCYEYVAKMVF